MPSSSRSRSPLLPALDSTGAAALSLAEWLLMAVVLISLTVTSALLAVST